MTGGAVNPGAVTVNRSLTHCVFSASGASFGFVIWKVS